MTKRSLTKTRLRSNHELELPVIASLDAHTL